MNIFGIGLPEMAMIFIVALLIFGPKKLPEIGRSLGKTIRGFQEASKEFETEFKKEAERIEKVVNEPMKATLEPKPKKALTPAVESAESGNKAPIAEPTAETIAETIAETVEQPTADSTQQS